MFRRVRSFDTVDSIWTGPTAMSVGASSWDPLDCEMSTISMAFTHGEPSRL